MPTVERPRHPELRNKAGKSILETRLDPGENAVSPVYGETKRLMRDLNLVTVCEEAACPNIGECWAQKHATVMILGEICTRSCAFCNVRTGKPNPVNPLEPEHVGIMAVKTGLRHMVITSVDRDDLGDGGADHFASLRKFTSFHPAPLVEVLTPDFRDKDGALECTRTAKPDVFNHNLETVPRLYPPSGQRALFP